MKDRSAYFDLLRQKRIGIIASQSIESTLARPLQLAQVSFSFVDAMVSQPGDPELECYHNLILNVSDASAESNWLKPENLKTNTTPLLLAGKGEDIYARISLQEHCDDVIFAPFVPRELIFRLCRLTSGAGRHRNENVRSAKPCVLVADDDRDMAIYLKSVLGNLDADVHVATDGRMALAAARKLLPDLLLLDVGMPLMNGIDVLRCLRNDPGTSALVVILITASTDPTHVENGMGLGASDYILKPFRHIELIRKLKPLIIHSKPLTELVH